MNAPAVRDEYARNAPDYDRRWGRYDRVSDARTLAALRPAGGERLLDVGCGTGSLLAAVGREVPCVERTGVDLSPDMLALAGRKLGPGVRLVEADAARLPFADGSFDAAATCSALRHWPDPAACLAELRRVLVPGGRLAVTDWCDDYLACQVVDRYLRLVNRSHVRAYTADGLRRLLAAAGFRDVSVESYRVNWLWGLMTASGRP